MNTEARRKTSEHGLKKALEGLLQHTDLTSHLDNDPVGIVREYGKEDQELVGLVASCLAYGRVAMLRNAIGDVLERFGDHPTQTLQGLSDAAIGDRMRGFSYRMSAAEDVADLLIGIRSCLHEFETLESCYLQCEGSHLQRASHLVQAIRLRRFRKTCSRGLRYLLPDPFDQSATKRLHLYFRWMVRPDDGIDLGLWSRVSPSELLMPLDTHTARFARHLGLTTRVSADLKMVEEVSKALAKLDGEDPIRYDFALCHLGISTQCIHTYSEQHCTVCPVRDHCLHSLAMR